MRLTDLDPRWVGHGGEGVSDSSGNPVPFRHGVGLSFLCPCPTCSARWTGDRDTDFHLRVFVYLSPAMDGGPPVGAPSWDRAGDTFETLVLRPSILSTPPFGCGWHGYVGGADGTQPGEVVTV